jgi:hypothetical protein
LIKIAAAARRCCSRNGRARGQVHPVTKKDTLEIAIERLITACESGKRDEIAKATEQVEIVLRGRRLL